MSGLIQLDATLLVTEPNVLSCCKLIPTGVGLTFGCMPACGEIGLSPGCGSFMAAQREHKGSTEKAQTSQGSGGNRDTSRPQKRSLPLIRR